MAKKTKKRKQSSSSSSSSSSSKENSSENSDSSDKSSKSISSSKKSKSKNKILSARKKFHNMVLNFDSQKEGKTFSEYLGRKRKEETDINQLAIEAKLDSDSIGSLTNFLKDNSFSELSESNSEDEEDKEKKENKNKRKKRRRKNKNNNIGKNNKKQSKNSGKLLDGKVVSFTGAMIISKEGLKRILVNLGAKITSTVTTNTNVLIHGEYLEDGRSYATGKKYKLAKAKKIDIYSDREFEQYMEKLTNTKWRMKDEVEKLGV